MDSTHEDATKDNPQVGGRTKENTHDGTEDRTRSGDVQELNQIDAPRGHRDIIGTVLQAVRGSLTLRLRTKRALYKTAVKEVAE